MALPYTTDSIDALPEPLREHYAADQDGEFKPNVEGNAGS
jgi:hypothetical protein